MGPLVDRLREELQRDPSDRDVAFLLTLAVRKPLVIYDSEADRLRKLARAQTGGARRDAVIAEAVEQLLARSVPRPRA